MSQSRKHSIAEVVSSTVVGYVISVVATAIILPLYGFEIDTSFNLQISLIFTVISVLRGYAFRRVWNYLENAKMPYDLFP